MLSFVSNLIGSTSESAVNLYLLHINTITGACRWKKVTIMPVQMVGFYYLWFSMDELSETVLPGLNVV